MFRGHHVIAAIAPFLLVPVLAVGCSDDEKATPQVVFEGQLQTTQAQLEPDEKNCNETGTLFTIGAFGNPALDAGDGKGVPSDPKKDGDSDQQGSVGVSCSVKPAGADEFDVSGSATLTGATGGTFTLRPTKVRTTGEQTNVSATFSKRNGLVYNQTDGQCIIRYTTPFQGVAAGRIWGEIECPKVTNQGALVACKAVAQFRFENCDQ